VGDSTREAADGRTNTDASLAAERGGSDSETTLAAIAARRELDDLIERDRILADAKLLKFRDSADRTLSRERFESPSPSRSISVERDLADECKRRERKMADALLKAERHRSDVAVETQRMEHDALRAEHGERRVLTDFQLSSERDGADITANALGIVTSELADSRTEQGRRDDVLSIVAHDLRSPLSVISLTAENLAQMTPGSFKPQLVNPITSAVFRMERLLDDLLDLARIESGTLRIVKRRLDIGVLLSEVLRSYGPMFAARGITFTVAKPAHPTVLFFDHDRIVQVLSNLLGNAMKFTPQRGKVALQVDKQVDCVVVALSDDGPGIPPDVLPHVFERFLQIDSDTRRGLGIGLHICENIIHAHKGRIWAESEFGNGATFRFTLPASE
jgi:signal transduction histidine kinase